MKTRSSFVISCMALPFLLLGCGAALEVPETTANTSAAATGVTTGVQTANATAAASGENGGTDPAAFGKRCYATCSVVSVGAASCPANIGGFGNTTFLGGCNKACRKAEGDAASKLPPGCALYTCNFSGC